MHEHLFFPIIFNPHILYRMLLLPRNSKSLTIFTVVLFALFLILFFVTFMKNFIVTAQKNVDLRAEKYPVKPTFIGTNLQYHLKFIRLITNKHKYNFFIKKQHHYYKNYYHLNTLTTHLIIKYCITQIDKVVSLRKENLEIILLW